MGMSSAERPGAVKGAPIGAAKRTLYREDRSEIMAEEGKQRDRFRAILKRVASQTDARVSTIVLSERGTVPGGNVSGIRNRCHLTRLSELKWIRQAKAVESLAFHTRI
jgi:hypothetical protein